MFCGFAVLLPLIIVLKTFFFLLIVFFIFRWLFLFNSKRVKVHFIKFSIKNWNYGPHSSHESEAEWKTIYWMNWACTRSVALKLWIRVFHDLLMNDSIQFKSIYVVYFFSFLFIELRLRSFCLPLIVSYTNDIQIIINYDPID